MSSNHAAAVRQQMVMAAVRPEAPPARQRGVFLAIGSIYILVAICVQISQAVIANDGLSACSAEEVKHMNLWVTGYAARGWIAGILTLIMSCMWVDGEPVQYQGSTVRSLHRSRELLSYAFLLLFIVANTWIQAISQPCRDAAPLQRLSIALVALSYTEFLAPLAFVLLLGLALCCCLPLFLTFGARFGLIRPAQTPATERDIEGLAEVVYSPGSDPSTAFADASCPICMVSYEEGEPLRVLPCGTAVPHHFHKKCVDQWLKINANCPICRHPVFDSNGRPATATSTATATATSTATAAADRGADRDADRVPEPYSYTGSVHRHADSDIDSDRRSATGRYSAPEPQPSSSAAASASAEQLQSHGTEESRSRIRVSNRYPAEEGAPAAAAAAATGNSVPADSVAVTIAPASLGTAASASAHRTLREGEGEEESASILHNDHNDHSRDGSGSGANANGLDADRPPACKQQ